MSSASQRGARVPLLRAVLLPASPSPLALIPAGSSWSALGNRDVLSCGCVRQALNAKVEEGTTVFPSPVCVQNVDKNKRPRWFGITSTGIVRENHRPVLLLFSHWIKHFLGWC